VLERQLPLLRAHYQHKRDVMVSALKREFGSEVTWPDPRGGFFLWATLPQGIDSDAMIGRAVEHGVIYVAGDAFFVDRSGQNVIRLSFSAPTPDRIEEGVARLGRALRAELGLTGPAVSSPGEPRPAAR
jgi:DNA-binding transcriptional MocR family regulator